MVLFVSDCLLRCSYCHNPDTWRSKNGPTSQRNRSWRDVKLFSLLTWGR
ncbi:4Fe-4S cluster-binding domain-containing protein [Bradyrhizobium sp. URHC0002]